jgi:hypothetical protein
MTHPSELIHKFEVEIHGVPAPIIERIVVKALSLYYLKYENIFNENENERDEFSNVSDPIMIAVTDINYSASLDGLIDPTDHREEFLKEKIRLSSKKNKPNQWICLKTGRIHKKKKLKKYQKKRNIDTSLRRKIS